MEKEQAKKILGMNSGGGASVYKLNKVKMSGDDGSFRLLDLVTEREKGTKAPVTELGKEITGVILKMRWQLNRYEDGGSLVSTEYDDKWNDEVTVYPMKAKGSVEDMKQKYQLGTLRIVYMYVSSLKQVVRLVVKSSALSGEKNPEGEKGLFEYTNEFLQEDSLPCEYLTICKGVFRKGTNNDGSENRRKDHYAMSFSRGAKLTDEQYTKIETLMQEVDEKTKAHALVKEDTVIEPPQRIPRSYEEEHANDEINPDDIPF